MMILFRIFFTWLFAWRVSVMWTEARASLDADINNAWNFALVVLSGIAASITWAPVLGEAVATPITSTLTDGNNIDETNRLLRMVRWCERRGYRHAVLFLCFLEGIRHPRLPAQFVIAMRNASPGSWLERVFAREVYRFDNVANAVKARDLLRLRHDIDPGPHNHLEVNLALLSADRTGHPELDPLMLPPAGPPPPLRRNPRIRLFAGADPAWIEESGEAPSAGDPSPDAPPAGVDPKDQSQSFPV